MSGRAPDTTKAWNFLDHFRETGPSWTTLPEHFKKHGYYTGGSGKLFHPGLPPNEDNPNSWSIDFTDPVDDFGGTANTGCACDCFNNKSHYEPGSTMAGCTGCQLDDDIQCSDVLIKNNVTAQLHGIARDKSKQPFFLAMGYATPHFAHSDCLTPTHRRIAAGSTCSPDGFVSPSGSTSHTCRGACPNASGTCSPQPRLSLWPATPSCLWTCRRWRTTLTHGVACLLVTFPTRLARSQWNCQRACHNTTDEVRSSMHGGDETVRGACMHGVWSLSQHNRRGEIIGCRVSRGSVIHGRQCGPGAHSAR